MNPSDPPPTPPLAPPPPPPIALLDLPPKPILAPPPESLILPATPKPFSLKEFLKGLHAEFINVLSAKDQVRPYLQRLKNFFTEFSAHQRMTRRHKIYILLFAGAVAGLVFLYKVTRPPPKRLTFSSYKPSDFSDVYDVIVVGAGPGGTACAFHLAKKGKKVLLLEKKSFPRDKYCGEAVTHGAQEELAAMGVLQGLLDDHLAFSIDTGGFVSPCGNSFVGSSLDSLSFADLSSSPSLSSSSAPSGSESRPASPRPPSPSPAPSEPPSRPPSPRAHSPLPASPSPTSNNGFRGVLTIKRLELDHRLAKAAQDAGAVLMQNMNVLSAEFDDTTGVWSVECKDEHASAPPHPLPNLAHHRGSIGGGIFNDAIPTTPTLSSTPHLSHDDSCGTTSSVVKVVYKGRALVCADGATSRLARSLGVVHSEPTAVCSRSYVQVPHAFKWDGMLFYPPSILPGCCAIVRHVGGELSYMTFINPAIGGQAKEDDLSRLHHEFIKTDPYISQALGPFIYLERMKAASLRIGGVGTGMSLNKFRTVSSSRAPTGNDRSYGDHLLVVGDAAGFVDPLTGLGIEYALEGGKIAAGVLLEGFYQKDLSMQFLEVYEKRWEEAFGNNFYWSLKMGQLLCRFPILLDATAKLIQRKGEQFLAEWMQAMTGTRSKAWFLSLGVWPFLFTEIILELIRRQIRQR